MAQIKFNRAALGTIHTTGHFQWAIENWVENEPKCRHKNGWFGSIETSDAQFTIHQWAILSQWANSKCVGNGLEDRQEITGKK
jgi:hypothetical protein